MKPKVCDVCGKKATLILAVNKPSKIGWRYADPLEHIYSMLRRFYLCGNCEENLNFREFKKEAKKK